MRCSALSLAVAVFVHVAVSFAGTEATEKKHHHRHRHHHKHGHKAAVHANRTFSSASARSNSTLVATSESDAAVEAKLVGKMKQLEQEIKSKEAVAKQGPFMQRGRLHVNGPLPVDFAEEFSEAVSKATGCPASEVTIVATSHASDDPRDMDRVIDFQAPVDIVHAVEDQAADPESKLAAGEMRPYLTESGEPSPISALAAKSSTSASVVVDSDDDDAAASAASAPVQDSGIDIDTAMPYGELEPFGREDTAQELTEQSISESNEMVDQLERAEVAEEKRAVFRALTRLRGAAITSFDGIARSQTGNIDEYNKVHKWRNTHPLRHLADEESDVSKWAFPDDADF